MDAVVVVVVGVVGVYRERKMDERREEKKKGRRMVYVWMREFVSRLFKFVWFRG